MNDDEGWYGSPRRLQVFALGITTLYIGMIFLVWVAAPTLEFEAYPTQCPEDSQNCSRIGPNPYRASGEQGIVVNASKSEVMSEIIVWIDSQSRTEVVTESQDAGYIHSVFRSFAIRFPDDMLFHVECDNGTAVIWTHSESRLGVYDFMVNDDRVLSFAEHIENQQWSSVSCE